MKIVCNIDRTQYRAKPEPEQIRKIQCNLETPQEIDVQDLFGVICSGGSFRTAAISGNSDKGFISQQLFAVDIDNAKEIIGEKVIETLDKTKEKLEHFNVSEKIDKAKEIIGEMTAPAVEPVYTQVDMSAAPAQDEIASSSHEENTASVSATYAEPQKTVSTTVKFFDDSESEP